MVRLIWIVRPTLQMAVKAKRGCYWQCTEQHKRQKTLNKIKQILQMTLLYVCLRLTISNENLILWWYDAFSIHYPKFFFFYPKETLIFISILKDWVLLLYSWKNLLRLAGNDSNTKSLGKLGQFLLFVGFLRKTTWAQHPHWKKLMYSCHLCDYFKGAKGKTPCEARVWVYNVWGC